MFRQIAFAVILTSLLLTSDAQSVPPQSGGDKLADGPGKKLVERACITCHAVRTVTTKHVSGDEWAEEVDKMVARGAVLTDDETDQVIDYLSTHYGPDDSKPGRSSAPDSASKPTPDKTVPPASSAGTTPLRSSDTPAQVNVNKAGVQELESSLGLSETEADAIVHYREQKGNFKAWQEVASVPGVPAEKIRDNQKRLSF